MHFLLLGIGVLVGMIGLYRFFLNANLKQITTLFLVGGFVAVCIALFFLAVTGRLPAALGLLAALWPMGAALWHRRKNRGKHGQNAQGNITGGAMTRKEALEVLGLKDGADAAEIKAAHKKLIKKTHPDQEGSQWLAAKINQAKDTLLD